jgi:hypothetical protein
MFDSLKKLCDNVKNLESNKILVSIWFDKSVQDFILDLNRLNQLFKSGVDANNELLGYYSPATEWITKGKSYQYGGLSSKKTSADHITLYDTGMFYKSFRVKVYKDGFIVYANSIVDDGSDLTEIYGQDIIGLTNESTQELYNKILPLVVQNIRETILKGVL